MRRNRTELAVLWYILKSLSTANMQILFYYPSTLARFFSEYPEFCSRIGGQTTPGWWLILFYQSVVYYFIDFFYGCNAFSIGIYKLFV